MLEGCVPWPESLAARYRAEGVWEGLTIFEMVERTATRVPEKTAVVHDGRRVSYAELVAKSARLADGLFRLGIQPLDRVVMQLPNGLEFVFVYLALCRIGAIPVMALRAHRHAEVRHFVRASGAVGYVIADRRRQLRLPHVGGRGPGRVSGPAPCHRRGRTAGRTGRAASSRRRARGAGSRLAEDAKARSGRGRHHAPVGRHDLDVEADPAHP